MRMDYDEYICNDHNKYDFPETTNQIRTKKIICEAPMGSGKQTVIGKWISAHKTDRFMVIVPTVNIPEEFFAKLSKTNKNINIRLCVNDNVFKEFHKAVHDEANVIITT